jgi:Ser/Thr protein kinase RdoA (MazF antagonist)
MENQLSYRGFLFRLRRLAKKALEAYELKGAALKFIYYSGNGLYQVVIPETGKSDDLFVPGRYALRLHQPGYMKPEHISSELEWLSALREEGIAVPEPIKNSEGKWLTTIESEYKVPTTRNCTLLRWVRGRLVNKNPRPWHMKALGRVTGRLHTQSIRWKLPTGFKRRHWDWEGLFGDGAEYGVPAKDVHEAIPKVHRERFAKVIRQVQEVFDQLGKSKNVYGLIHADMGVDSNVLFLERKARPIDFDDSGFGYWIFDLGVILAHYVNEFKDTNPRMRDALLEGYEETKPSIDVDYNYLDLFIAARYAQLMYFYQMCALKFPQSHDEAMEQVNSFAGDLKNHLKLMR